MPEQIAMEMGPEDTVCTWAADRLDQSGLEPFDGDRSVFGE